MAYQTSANVLVTIKRETVTGTAATGGASTGSVLRITDSPGLELKRAPIQSQEKRDDGLKTLGRLGGKSVDGSFNAELTIGGATDILLEAVMRSTWAAAAALTTATGSGACVDLTCATTSTITRTGSGSFITDGWKAGDIAVLTNYSTAADNSINLRVVTVVAGTLTVAGTPLTVGAADTACVLTRLKKLVSAATPTRYSHTIEVLDQDITKSELFLGVRCIGFKLSCKPGQMATVQWMFAGLDRTLTVSPPWFTSPAVTTGLGLIADDSAIRYNGADVATFTGFDIEYTINAKGEPVIGNLVGPDVFDNDCEVKASVSSIRSDFASLTAFDAATEFEVAILLQEPTGTPKACLGIYLPRVLVSALSASASGGDGAKVETRQLMVGPAVATTTLDAGIANIASSAA